MAKYRLHEITQQDIINCNLPQDTDIGYCLMDKLGDVYISQSDKIPVYIPHSYGIMRPVEAYCFFKAWCKQEEIEIKKYTSADLCTQHFDEEIIKNPSHASVEILRTNRVLDDVGFSKHMNKAQQEVQDMISYLESMNHHLQKITKQISKDFEENIRELDEEEIER